MKAGEFDSRRTKVFLEEEMEKGPSLSVANTNRRGCRKQGFVTAILVLLTGLLYAAFCQAQIIGTGQLSVARRSHTATLLQDGKILIVGGDDQNSLVNQAEIFDPVSLSSSIIASSPAPRTDHTATLLADGRVLIIGGVDGNGPLNSSEFYSPNSVPAPTFLAGPALMHARSGHTATVLADGKILIVGGEPTGSAEIYNPENETFSLVAGSLNTPRQYHSAVLLNNGKVLIVGGVVGTNTTLTSAEIYDPQTQTFIPASGPLQTPRGLALLRVLPDGKVQIIGGDGEFSMEMFDPDTNSFIALAHIPPHEDYLDSIITSRTRSALLTTIIQQNPVLQGQLELTPEFVALLNRLDHTVTEIPQSNRALIAGGVNDAGQILSSAAVVSSSAATVTTDKLDYAPGEIVTITGNGFQPNETVWMLLHEEPETRDDTILSSVADNQGNFTNTDFAPALIDLNRNFTLTAIGESSGFTAQTAFRDSNNFNVTPLTQTVAAGSVNTFTWTFTAQNNGNQQTTTFTVPAGWTAPQTGPGPGQVTVTAGTCAASLQSVVGMVITIRQSPPAPATGTCGNNTTFTLTYANATAPTPVSPPQTYMFVNQHGQDPTVTVTAALADLSVAKTDSPDPVNAGGNITYTVTVTNNGPSSAQSVSLSDTVPTNTTFVSNSGATGWSCNNPSAGGMGTISCSNPSFANGAKSIFTIVVKVNANTAAATTISNTAAVSSTTTDPTPGNNSATATTTVNTSADLAITKTDSPDPVSAGNNITYTINVANNGPSDAQSVSLSDTVPTNTTFVSNSGATGWTCTDPSVGGTGTISCTRATFANGASSTFTVVVKVNASTATGTTITNTATVSSTTTDPASTNNSATATTTVNTSADLAVTKTDSPDPVIAGNNITYTITVTNNGPSDAQSVSLSDTVPTNTTFVSNSGATGWTCTDPSAGGTGTISCTRATFANGASSIFTVVVKVDPSAANGSTISNTATISSSTTDPTNGNNSATATTAVNNEADLSVTKDDGVTQVTAGEPTVRTYTITVSNAGPSNAAGVTLTDTWPAGFTRGTITPPSGVTCSDTTAPNFSCNVGTLAAGANKVITVTYTVPASTAAGTQTNTVAVSSTTTDPSSANNTASDTNTVITSADVSVTKDDGVTQVTAGEATVRTYTITVSNAGPSNATGVTLTDTWPVGFTRGTITPPSGVTCADTTAPNFSCNVGNLAAGTNKVITVTYTVPASTGAGPQTNTVSVSSTTSDPNTSNNTVSDTNTVITSADVSVTKDDGVTQVTAGEPTTRTYTITVSNAGPSNAANVTLTDTWPAGFTRGTITPAAGVTCADTTAPNFSCNVGTLASGTNKVITVTYSVPASTAAGPQTNTVTVASTTDDPNGANNTASDSNTVKTSADLSVTKNDGVNQVTAGDGVTYNYTITVSNAGPSDAANVMLSDSWPAGFSRGALPPGCANVGSGPNFTCTLGTIAAGGSATRTVSYTVPASTAAGTQTNTVTVTSDTEDPNTTNNMASDNNTVKTSADLSVTKSDGVSEVTAGDGVTYTYTITVTNAGPSDGANVMLSDTWPAGFSRGTLPLECSNVGTGPSFSCNFGTVAAGASVVRTVSYTVPASTAAGPQTNTVTVSSTTEDPNTANNTASDTNTVKTSADLSVAKSDGVTEVTAGDGVSYTYTLTIINAGPSDGANVTLDDTWPAGFSRGTLPAECSNVGTGPSFSCNFSTVAAGASVVRTVSYTVPASTAAGTQTNTVTVASATDDPNAGNNTATDTNTVKTSADLSVTKSDGVTEVTAGDGVTYTYTITISNAGPSDGANVVMTDTWPAGFTRGTLPAGCSNVGSGPNFTCNLGTIGAGASVVKAVSYTVPASTAAGTQTNTASVTSDTPDPNGTNNSASDTNTVKTSADLSVTKSDSPDPVVVGETLTYTLNVTNAGPSNAINVSVSDTLPSGVTYNAVAGSGWNCSESGGTVTCTRPGLSVGTAPAITITVTPTAAGTITNVVTVNSATPDPNGTNNTASENTTVNRRHTTTTVSVSPNSIQEGQSSTVYVTVTDDDPKGSKSNPSGIVTVSSSINTDTITGTCTLMPQNSDKAACQVTLTAPDDRVPGPLNGYAGLTVHTITANFNATSVHAASSGSAGLTVSNVAPVLSSLTPSVFNTPIGTAVTVTGNYSDVGTNDTHDCYVNWDDGTPNQKVAGVSSAGQGSCSATRTFLQQGVYSISMYVEDDDGGKSNTLTVMVTVFDPSGGFVTGGGWIMSPAGASTLYPTATGKANFGFVSKYKKGSNIPEGQTEFQFKAGDLNFHSSSYDYGSLVVSGHKAQYKGTGTINGVPGYKFVLTAYDGQAPGGGGIDKFRMKITQQIGNAVIYDNRMGGSDDIDAADPMAISGGSIVIHDGKDK